MSLEETLETGLLERGVRTQEFDLSTPLTQNCWKRAWAAACWMSSAGTKRNDFMVVESLAEDRVSSRICKGNVRGL